MKTYKTLWSKKVHTVYKQVHNVKVRRMEFALTSRDKVLLVGVQGGYHAVVVFDGHTAADIAQVLGA